MTIRIDDHAQNLKMLLFIRQAWKVAQDVEIPELSPVPETGSSKIPESPSRAVWDARWKQQWDRSWSWFNVSKVQEAPLSQNEMQNASSPGQDLHPIVPPFWPVEYGEDGVDLVAFNTWDRQTMPNFPSHAEQDSLSALIDAWQDGLTTIVVLPYSGYFAHRFSSSHLVVSAETRNDQKLYTEALQTSR
ncbi:hypothetical protein LOC59_03610 [Arthrobacter sp. zg-Y916]|uniref:hypothetical protein n=1 Tax=Arthrobacter sp. zg-Y916 TaxID=2894190 RepID=UPI001E49E3C6|nr:hypothetical protein [Arthrobacter sp. zg-Y916]MCC9192741.1 hypothetical protein [Arthrobacter sp. zg-Y916]